MFFYYEVCKDLLPAPGNRSNETHDIERRTYDRREGSERGEKGERWRKKNVFEKKGDGWTMYLCFQVDDHVDPGNCPAVYFQVDDHVDPGNCPAAVSSEKTRPSSYRVLLSPAELGYGINGCCIFLHFLTNGAVT
ncbi:hypothetical protein TNCV_1286131 [Trichonephila clavipes]|uniref:Uncharacterized protein n=1 Tax=Trichonephila clavipes TaxID=2585209 RepID=A0A8X6VP98_TRICX|nr:hypothetical protein TNCV_1286131 [Trichonephila clavipes]